MPPTEMTGIHSQTFPKIMSSYTTVYTNHWMLGVRYLNIISSYTNSYTATTHLDTLIER